MYTMESFTLIFTIWLNHADSLSVGTMVSARMFAKAFEILTTKNRDVCVKLTLALAIFAVNLFGLNIVEIMVLVTMSAKTRTRRSNRPTVLT
jgi:hypothetical protein